MLGILVALVKIAQLATVIPGIGIYAAGTFIVLLSAVMVTFDDHGRSGKCRVGRWQRAAPPPGSETAGPGEDNVTAAALSAPKRASCPAPRAACWRGRRRRKTRASAALRRPPHLAPPQFLVQYTWALVIAAAICYIPANVLPVLTTTALGSTESDTIVGGVIFSTRRVRGRWP